MNAAVEAEALIVIGTIESELAWNLVDYATPIKLGVAQWRGTMAAQLLENLPVADKANLSQSILDDLGQYGSTDPFWDSRYLTLEEGNSIVVALGTSTAESYQRSYFSAMINKYANTMASWGCVPDGTLFQRKAFVFLAAIYHVDISTAGMICSAIGATATPDTIYDAIMNTTAAPLRDWRRVRDALNDWDGGIEPATGTTEEPWTDPGGPGDGQTIITQVNSQVQRIGMSGQQLIVYGEDNEGGTLCWRNSSGMWIPVTNTAAPPTPTPEEPPAPVEPSEPGDFAAMRQLWYDHEEEFSYGWGAGRLDPLSSGFTDCSGCIYWAVNEIRPDLAESLGNFTTPQSHAGTLIAEGELSDEVTIDPAILREGDIVLVSKSGNYSANGDSHVEWYFGNDTLWGAGYAPLPHFSSSSVSGYLQAVSDRYSTYMIRRFL